MSDTIIEDVTDNQQSTGSITHPTDNNEEAITNANKIVAHDDHPYVSIASTPQRPVVSVKEFLAFSRVQNHVAKNTTFAFHNPDTQQIGFIVSNFLYVSDRLA